MTSPFNRAIALIALILLSGWLSLMLAVPPGYASPIWPPSGIALAALLLWGRRYWPAVWIGLFIINLWLGSAHGTSIPTNAALSAMAITSGSTLQALVAVWMTRKWVRASVPKLNTSRIILLFFGVAGPLSCLVAPTIGVSALLIAGLMPTSAAFFSWWNWWIGDSLGVIIVAPLMFSLFASPRDYWARQRLTVILPQLILLTALIAAFVFVYRAEQARLQLEFDHSASIIDRALAERLNQIYNGSRSLQDLYKASTKINRQEFAMFSRGVLERYPEIQVLEWLPRVSQEQLRPFEASIRAEGYAGFKITERGSDGVLVPVQPRPEYFPVVFIEPFAGNEPAFGFDSASNPRSWHPKALARASGQPTVSQKLKLVQDTGDVYGVLISTPVYQHGAAPTPDRLAGFVTGIFRPGQLISKALEGLNPELFGVTLLDLSAPEQDANLFTLPVKHALTQGDALRAWKRTLRFGDREWQLVITPDRSFITTHGSPLAWTTLIGGLVFTALLNMYLLTITGQTAQVQSLVQKRTREVRESERRLRFLLETSPIAIRIARNNGREVVFANPKYDELIMAEPGHAISVDPRDYYANPNDYEQILHELALGGRVENRLVELAIPEKANKWTLASYLPIEYGGEKAIIGWFYDITDRIQTTRALEESEISLRSAQEVARLGSWTLDVESNRLTWSEQTYRIFGIDPSTPLTYEGFLQCVHPDDQEQVNLAWENALQGAPYDLEHRIQANGQTRWVHEHAELKFDGSRQLVSGIGTVQDITERKQAEEKLVLAARVFSEAHEGITITDAQGIIIDVNPTFCEITGYRREEVIGRTHSLLKSGKHPDEFYVAMWQALTEQGHWQGEVWNRRSSGELYAELLTISALRDESSRTIHYVGLFSDITQIKHQQQTLEMMAHYDVLTRLPNRALFADRFSQAIARCKRESGMQLAVCYLDLDGFKQVNDTLGHEAGDQLLVQVAERIRSMLREEDTVSRLGGDEFALLLGAVRSLEQCEQALERIHRTIAQPYLIDNQSVTIGASSGVTIYPLDDADPDTLLRHADQAMYQAKLAGRNRFHLFDAAHDQQLQQHRLQLEAIEEAFARQELHLHYQPKVNMKTGLVFGAEALIRWMHLERGMIAPADFLPVVEGSPFEIQLGNWVIEQAMNQIERWNAVGLDLQVSVNISPRHLQWHGFFANLDETLSRHPAMPSRQFELEVLESSIVEDMAAVSEVLSGCRDALGVSIALDDFGTGYSSLTHLRHLPANMIKIDQSFVRDMLDDPDDYAIIAGVVGLAGAFRRGVIAEGVETAEHGLLLLNMGCLLAQGYGIARPMPAEAMHDWVRNYQPHPAWIDYLQHPPSAREAVALALRLEAQQWIRRIEECLDTDNGTTPRWPIMNPAKCHCGRWAIHAKHEGLFSAQSIASYVEAHERMHQVGNRLMQLYQEGKKTEARQALPDLQACHAALIHIMAEMNGH